MAITSRHITAVANFFDARLFRDSGGHARHDAAAPGASFIQAAPTGSPTPHRGAGVVRPMKPRHVSRALAAATQAGVAVSLVGATALHVGWAHKFDAVRQTVSDYALDDDAHQVFAATVACLSVGSMSLLASAVRSRFPVGGAPTVLLGTWCAGLALCAAFRTDPGRQPDHGRRPGAPLGLCRSSHSTAGRRAAHRSADRSPPRLEGKGPLAAAHVLGKHRGRCIVPGHVSVL
ncbi:DUF998 domain-containing protein [Streptomyces sp. NBC_00286]|uniref:DUF998 domain-containing protein n=1 Tax=Streptomyces sp. NBC_00286 TaxID=2975701 RepID=UPI002E27ED30|nr:DUF998 domain-containing protein [Streptomyces sp. NBC_00286]